MAIFHMAVKTVSRGKAQSAVAKAAYNARASLKDERTGETKNYTRTTGLTFSGIFAPKDAPQWANDREALWNAVEVGEKRKDAQLARDITLGLPHELTDEQRKQLVTDFVREQFQRKGMVADVNIHAPGGMGDDRNYHAHILLTMREIGPDGFGQKAREWNSKENLEKWREAWERTQNRYLERYGHEARVDRRTLEAQGIDRAPTNHLGPQLSAMERRNEMETDRGTSNRDTFSANQEAAKLKVELAQIQRQIREAERENEWRPPWQNTSPKFHFEDAARSTTDSRHTSEIPTNLNGTAADIWKAYNLRLWDQRWQEKHPDGSTKEMVRTINVKGNRDPYNFAKALDEKGIQLAVATKEEAERSQRTAAFAKQVGNFSPAFREGEFVAVTRRGDVYKLTEHNTGVPNAQVQQFLAKADWKGLYGIEATRNSAHDRAAIAEAQRQSRRDEMMSARLGNARNSGKDTGRKIANDNKVSPVAKAPDRALAAFGKAALRVAEGVFSLFVPDPPKTPEQIDNLNKQRDRAAQRAEIDWSKYLYNTEHERIVAHQKEQTREQDREREDWNRQQKDRERER